LSVRRLDDDQLAGLDDVRRARYGESHKLGYDKKAGSNQRPRLMQNDIAWQVDLAILPEHFDEFHSLTVGGF
jgi:hypothetical protein